MSSLGMSLKGDSILSRTPLVSIGRRSREGKAFEVYRPAHQVGGVQGFQSIHTVSAKSPPSNLFQGSNQYQFEIEPGNFNICNDAWLEIKFTVTSSSARLAPTPLWIRQITFRNGQKDVFETYGQALLTNTILLHSQSQLEGKVLRMMNMGDDYQPLPSYAVNSSHVLYCPLNSSLLGFGKICFSELNGRLDMMIHTQSPVVSGSGVVTLTGMNLLVNSDVPSRADYSHIDHAYSNNILERRILQPQYLLNSGQTLTAGSEYQLYLDSFSGRFSHFIVKIMASGATNANNGLHDYISPGDGALIDFKDPTGQSIYGQGTSISYNFLKSFVWADHVLNNYATKKNLIPILFCHDLKRTYGGEIDGHIELRSLRNYISITPSAAGTSCVQTLTLSGTSASGTYQLMFKGYLTDSLAYNANVATIKAALEALPPFQQWPGRPLTVTVSAAISAGTSVTFTFDSTAGNVSDLVILVPGSLATSAPAAVSGSTALTTSGVPGFTTGTYDIFVVGYRFRQFSQAFGELFITD